MTAPEGAIGQTASSQNSEYSKKLRVSKKHAALFYLEIPPKYGIARMAVFWYDKIIWMNQKSGWRSKLLNI